MEIHLTLKPTGEHGTKSEFYEVIYEGECIVRSTDPEHEACRALEARGIKGKAHFWREGRSTWDSRMSTAWRARHYAAVNRRSGPVTTKWEPFPTDRRTASKQRETEAS